MAEREIKRIMAHFLRDGTLFQCEYWEIARKDKEVAHLKVAGSEKICSCGNAGEIRKHLETR